MRKDMRSERGDDKFSRGLIASRSEAQFGHNKLLGNNLGSRFGDNYVERDLDYYENNYRASDRAI